MTPANCSSWNLFFCSIIIFKCQWAEQPQESFTLLKQGLQTSYFSLKFYEFASRMTIDLVKDRILPFATEQENVYEYCRRLRSDALYFSMSIQEFQRKNLPPYFTAKILDLSATSIYGVIFLCWSQSESLRSCKITKRLPQYQ